VVNVENVCKAFGQQRVLNGVSLTVNPGETRAVLGRSGTGKSVLLRLIVGLQEPDSGTVKVFGQNITGLSIDQLAPIRKKMGFLFQHAALYESLNVASRRFCPTLAFNPRTPSKGPVAVTRCVSRATLLPLALAFLSLPRSARRACRQIEQLLCSLDSG